MGRIKVFLLSLKIGCIERRITRLRNHVLDSYVILRGHVLFLPNRKTGLTIEKLQTLERRLQHKRIDLAIAVVDICRLKEGGF